MAKPKIRFVCQSCGYVTAKWLGKCPECGQWDSFVEDVYKRQVQNRVSQASSSMPSEVSAYGITTAKKSAETIMYFALHSPDGDVYKRQAMGCGVLASTLTTTAWCRLTGGT